MGLNVQLRVEIKYIMWKKGPLSVDYTYAMCDNHVWEDTKIVFALKKNTQPLPHNTLFSLYK